jgi:amino acid transporter
VSVATIGNSATERPLAETASVLMNGGRIVVTIAVLISTYGHLSGSVLNCPRLVCSLASHGDFPRFFGKLHPRFNTPARATIVYALVVWVLAASGTFVWAVMVTGGSAILMYAATSAALIRLRQQNPHADASRIPLGSTLAWIGIVIAICLLTQLKARQALLIGGTALIATASWLWARHENANKPEVQVASVKPGSS